MLASAIRGGVRVGAATPRLSAFSPSLRALPSQRPTIASRLVNRSTPPRSRASFFHTTSQARSVLSPPEALSSSSTTTTGWYEHFLHHFDPIVPYVHALPEYLHIDGPHKYAISIAVATICIRAAITLPLHIFQRKRTRRYDEIVKPEFDRLRGPEGLPKSLLIQSKRAGKTHEQYRKDVETQLRSRFKELVKENKCHPIFNIALPLLATLPVFFALSFSIRAGTLQPSPFWNEILPWWTAPDDLVTSFKASAQMLADRGMDPEALKHLSQPMGPSLGQFDSTFIGPLILLAMNWSNIEMTQWIRRINLSQKSEVESMIQEQEKRKIGVKERENVQEVGMVRYKVVSWLLRLWTVLMIPISANVPGALVIYWISSSGFTLAQNIVFNIRDRKRKQDKQIEVVKSAPPPVKKDMLRPTATRPPPSSTPRRA